MSEPIIICPECETSYGWNNQHCPECGAINVRELTE